MKNNKGFTLLELLVCVIIFGVVVAAAFGFMLSGAKSYTKVNDRLEVQRQSQSALNLMQEYLMDCNYGVCFAPGAGYSINGKEFQNGTLYIVNKESDNLGNVTYPVHIFSLKDDKTLTYAKSTANPSGSNTFTVSVPASGDKVTDSAVEFKVDYSKTKTVTNNETEEKTIYLNSVDITLGLMRRSANYECTAKTALRNSPLQVTVQ